MSGEARWYQYQVEGGKSLITQERDQRSRVTTIDHQTGCCLVQSLIRCNASSITI